MHLSNSELYTRKAEMYTNYASNFKNSGGMRTSVHAKRNDEVDRAK